MPAAAQQRLFFTGVSIPLVLRSKAGTICRAYSLGHVTVISWNCWNGQVQLLGQPNDAGLTHPG